MMDVAVIGPELSNCLVATLSFGLHGSLAVTLGACFCAQTCIGSQGIQATSRSTTAFGHRCGELIQYHSWVKLGKGWGGCFLGHHGANASPLRPSCHSPARASEGSRNLVRAASCLGLFWLSLSLAALGRSSRRAVDFQ